MTHVSIIAFLPSLSLNIYFSLYMHICTHTHVHAHTHYRIGATYEGGHATFVLFTFGNFTQITYLGRDNLN